jgi:hypothetical protein
MANLIYVLVRIHRTRWRAPLTSINISRKSLQTTLRACLPSKYLNTTVFKCHDIIIVHHGIFYINLTNKTKYYKSWYIVDICKKLVIAIKTLSSSRVSNTQKISWYLTNYGI